MIPSKKQGIPSNLVAWLKLDERDGATTKEEMTERLLSVRHGQWKPGEGVVGLSLAHQAYSPASGTWRPKRGAGGALQCDGRATCLEIDSSAPGSDATTDQFAFSVFFTADESIIRGRQVLLEARCDPVGQSGSGLSALAGGWWRKRMAGGPSPRTPSTTTNTGSMPRWCSTAVACSCT